MKVFLEDGGKGISRLMGIRRAGLLGGQAVIHPTEVTLGSVSRSWSVYHDEISSMPGIRIKRPTGFSRSGFQRRLFDIPIGQKVWPIVRRYCHTKVGQQMLNLIQKSNDLLRARNKLVVPPRSKGVGKHFDIGAVFLSNGVRVNPCFRLSLNLEEV